MYNLQVAIIKRRNM